MNTKQAALLAEWEQRRAYFEDRLAEDKKYRYQISLELANRKRLEDLWGANNATR